MITNPFRRALLAGLSFAFSAASPALAQVVPATEQPPTAPADPDSDNDAEAEEGTIVVTGQRPRGSVVGDISAENVLTSRDLRATGATDVTELLDALAPQIGSARGRGGERPILLLNGQRISGFRELRDIPTEAIERVEILPEEVALKYGFRADQRVVNFVLRERFRSTAVRAEGSAATTGGYAGGLADATRLMIDRAGRTSINVHAEGNGALTESERDIARDPGAPDDRGARTLIGSQRLVRGTATHNRTILGDVSATLNTELSHSEGRSLLGFPFDGASAILGDGRARDTASDSAHAGLGLNGDKAGWRWSLTGNADVSRNITATDPSDIAIVSRDRVRSTNRSADLAAVANGKLFKLPAGEAGATLTVGVDRLSLDSSRRRDNIASATSLGRTAGSAGINLDLPVSRRRSDFDAIGNLTLNANAEVQRLSDFATLTTLGAGFNWSPATPLNLIGSWTREQGAPTIGQLGDPLLDTAGSRIFDFTRGETVLATVTTGGNPDLSADRRNVLKLGANLRPSTKIDLRLRADYVHTTIERPISNFPGPSAAIESAFSDRFQRAPCAPQPCTGELISADLRPVNFDSARRDTLRWGFDFTKPLRSARPSAAQIEQFRSLRAARGGAGADTPPPGGPSPPDSGSERGGPGGGSGRGGGGGFGGGRQGGRLQLSVTHTVNLTDQVIIRPGVQALDYLHGDALGATGGRPRHEIEAQAGWANNGLGARLTANWRSATRVDSAADSGALRFAPLATVGLRLFANPGERLELVARHPWLRGTQLRLEVDNLSDAKPRVRNALGAVPPSYQPDLLDPLGRTVRISLRKLFTPPRVFRGDGQPPR